MARGKKHTTFDRKGRQRTYGGIRYALHSLGASITNAVEGRRNARGARKLSKRLRKGR